MKILFYALTAMVLFSCTSQTPPPKAKKDLNAALLNEGLWRVEIQLSDSVTLPFLMNYQSGEEQKFVVKNGSEKINITDIKIIGDSIFMQMPVFMSGFEGIFTPTEIKGVFVKYDAENYRLPFVAKFNVDAKRFIKKEEMYSNLLDTYEVTFRPGQENEYKAVGEFTQTKSYLTGTFLTETGDYRYLEGLVDGDKVRLSSFDGNHLYVVDATVLEDGSLDGFLFSGKTGVYKWLGKENPDFELADPEKLTYVKEGASSIEFSLPLTNDEIVNFNAEDYKGKVVILQILGSWCPNCMDESLYLMELYEKYNPQGLEIIGLAFERKENKKLGYAAIDKMVKDLGITYPVVFAGSTAVANREKTLPQLNKIMSFPTSIYINKNGEVVKIHTGFNGPSTSKYVAFAEENEIFVRDLLNQ